MKLQEVLRICPAVRGKAAVDPNGVSVEHILATPTEAWQVQALLQLAAHQDFCIIPRGMGSSRAGGTSVLYDGQRTPIVIDLTSNRDIEVDVLRQSISVGCGVTNEEVQQAAARCGLFYPVDCYRYSSVGGNIATDAYGTESLAYGTTKDHVLGLDLILPDGSLLTTRSSVTPMGVDLTRLFLGSEGTLGIIWSARLRLMDIPAQTYTHIASFDSHETAFRSAGLLLRTYRPTLTAVKFMDAASTSSIGSEYMSSYQGHHVLLVRSYNDILPGFTAVIDRDAEFLWAANYNLMYEDAVRVSVEPTDADLLVHYSCKLAAMRGGIARVHGSVGLGIYHVSFTGMSAKVIAECATRTMSYVMSMLGGSLAVEGIGNTGNEIFVATQTDMARMILKIKTALDPLGIMNPKKVL